MVDLEKLLGNDELKVEYLDNIWSSLQFVSFEDKLRLSKLDTYGSLKMIKLDLKDGVGVDKRKERMDFIESDRINSSFHLDLKLVLIRLIYYKKESQPIGDFMLKEESNRFIDTVIGNRAFVGNEEIKVIDRLLKLSLNDLYKKWINS